MYISKVSFYEVKGVKCLVMCDVVLEGVLKLRNIRLFKNFQPNGKSTYYLVLPSKQDIIQEVTSENSSKVSREEKGKRYDEFYHPVSASFYEMLLQSILEGYKIYKSKGTKSYVPKFKKEVVNVEEKSS